MEQTAVIKTYDRMAATYDLVFSPVFQPGRQRIIDKMNCQPGDRILEVGVGTGLSLDAYPPHCQVTGVDLAPDMLEQAQEKITRNGWRHLKVMEMDALNMKFADNAFDYVMAFHVVSVVPDAQRLMREVVRVSKPGATIAIINHFRSRNRLLAKLDSLIEPITRRLGWHTLPLNDILADVPIETTRTYKTAQRSLFTIVIGKASK